MFTWLYSSRAAISHVDEPWPIVPVLIGLWALGQIVEVRGPNQPMHSADWAARLGSVLLVATAVWMSPFIGLLSCLAIVALSALEWAIARRAGVSNDSPRLRASAGTAGAALGLVGLPLTELLGLSTGTGGIALAIAGFMLIGISLIGPRGLEVSLRIAATIATAAGLLSTLSDVGSFSLVGIIAGCTTMFAAVANQDRPVGVAGYIAVCVGAGLKLAELGVPWTEPYLVLPALGALVLGHHYHRRGANSWAAYAPTIAIMSYVAMAQRLTGGSAWHAVIAGGIGVAAVCAGGYRRLVGPLITGTAVLAIVVGYEMLGSAALVPTWAWLALGGTVLLATGVAIERSDMSPLERGDKLRTIIATQFS